MAQVVKDINFKTKVTGTGAAKSKIQGVEKTAVNSAGKMSASFKKMGGVLAAAFGTQQILSFVLTAKNAARDAEEIRTLFEQVFSGIRLDAIKMAKDFSTSFKLANTSTMELLGNTGDLLVGFGFTEKAALNMSVEINRLAQDLASFRNIDTKTASLALTKALLGETESAKALGIVIRQSTKEFTDNVDAIMKAQGVTLLQAKAIEILRIAYRQSGKAVGDFERTQESLANQEKILSETFKQITEDIGTGLVPAFTGLTGAIQTLTDMLGDSSSGFISALTRISVIFLTFPLEIINWRLELEKTNETFKNINEISTENWDATKKVNSQWGMWGLGILPKTTKNLDETTTAVGKLTDAMAKLVETTARFSGARGTLGAKGAFFGARGAEFGGLAGRPGGDANITGLAGATEAGLKEGFDSSVQMMEGVSRQWTSTLESNFNEFWDSTFGHANSLLEQLLKMTFTGILSQALSFLPGGGILSGIFSLFDSPRSGGGRTGTSEVIVLQIGDENIGTFVRKGNEFNRMRRLN